MSPADLGPVGHSAPSQDPHEGGTGGPSRAILGRSEALSGSEPQTDVSGAAAHLLAGPSLGLQETPGAARVELQEEDVDAVTARLGRRRRPWTLPRLEGASRAAAGGFLAHHSGASLRSYARDLDDFAAWCEERGLDPLAARRGHIDLWQRDLEAAGRRPASIARQLSAIAGYFRLAVDDGLVERSAVAGVRRPRVGGDSPRLGLSRDQAHALLEAAATAGPRDHALACLLLMNGLRVSEAIAIADADLDEARGHRLVRIRRKGGALVDVPLAPRTAAAIDELRAAVGSGAPRLFLDGRGAPLDRFDAGRAVRRLARRACIAHPVSPHSLRHTFVTAALDAGVPLRDVQDAAGHADPRTTRRYDRGRYSLDRHATYAVARYLG
jgi:site-specific recombinase XerD